MATTAATPSRTTTSAFPLKYFVLAFAFTWGFWVPAALEARGLISPLPVPATFLGAFGFWEAVEDHTRVLSQAVHCR